MLDLMKRYRKFLAAAGAGLVILASIVSDGRITGPEWWAVIAAILGPLGVERLPNDPA